jgi:predicted RNA methylase
LILFFYWSVLNGITPTPTSKKQLLQILRALPHGFSGRIYDLGSGWGTRAIEISKQLPEAKIIGIENSPVPYFISELILLFLRRNNVDLIFANFMRTDLRDADLIVCYLFRGGMENLKPKLEAELKPGTTVISNTFAISGWKPMQILYANDLYRSPIYVYKSKERRQFAGREHRL